MQRANSTGSTLGADPHTHHSPQTDTQAATKKAATVDASTEEGKKALETLEALTSRPETKENRGRKAQAEIGAEIDRAPHRREAPAKDPRGRGDAVGDGREGAGDVLVRSVRAVRLGV